MSKRTTAIRRACGLRAERGAPTPSGPHAAIARLAALVYETQTDAFTVSAANLTRSAAYTP